MSPDQRPADGGWQRLHPLTPVLRGGRFLLVLVALVGQQGLRDQPPAGLTAGVLVVGTGLSLLAGLFAWRSTRYRLFEGELQLDSGLLQRRSRRVPLARVQSVDVLRPLVGRVLGLAELRLEVAGGGDTEARLSYLSETSANRLRLELLSTATAAASELGAPAPAEPPERVLVVVPTRVLITSVLLGAPALISVGLLVVIAVTSVIQPVVGIGAAAGGLSLLLGVGGVAVRRVLTEYGFTVAEAPDGLRLRHGLLETRSSSIPDGRVQAVRILEPLLWRRKDWVRVEVDVAGYAPGSSDQLVSNALLPVAPRAFADSLIARVLEGADDRPLPRADRRAPPAARWRAPLSARRLGVGLDDRHLVSASGVLTTTTDVVPLAKVQSLRMSAGPWQRRLGLASVHVDTAGRRLSGTTARHRDAADARALLVELDTRARSARTPGPAPDLR